MRWGSLLLLLMMGGITMPAQGNADSPAKGFVAPEVSGVAPGVWRLRFGVPEAFTPGRFRERPLESAGFSGLPAADAPPLKLGGIRCRVTPSRTVVYVPCDEPQDTIYGFGLDPACYQQKGLRKWLTVAASKIGQTGASHGPVPFYLSTKGYGIYVDTARVPLVDVARLTPKTVATNRRAAPEQMKTSESAESEGVPEVVFDLPGNSSGVDVFVFGGPTMRESVQRYNLFSGGGCMPPMWGLGMKYRTYTHADQERALAHARGLRKHRIPADMFGLEPGWHSKAYSCSFVWSEKRFPAPRDMLDTLRGMGFKVNLWEHAYIHPTSPMFEPLLERSGDYLVWGGLVVDFADPEASRIFADYHDNHLVSMGVAGFKADECDRQPIDDCTPFNYPYCSDFPSGIAGDQMTQLYGYLYQQSIYSVYKRRNQRTWGDVRATTALAAPLPFCLYSDAYAFDEYLRQLLNASFTGLLWSPEVRSADSYEEYLNRMALSSFAPQMCLDAWFIPNPLWTQYDRKKNEQNELFAEEEEARVAGRMREIAGLRMQLLPYLYAQFHRYRTTGLPPVRSLLLDFPGDAALRKIDDAFLFGDALLVAPFIGTATTREVYLPRGADWFDFRTGERMAGGATITAEGRPGDVPLYVRDYSLLPLAEPVEYVDRGTVFDITVRVYGKAPRPFVLFEDDGESFDYEHGVFNTVELSWARGKGKVVRQGAYKGKRYRIVGWER